MSIQDITIVITSFRSTKKIRKCLNSIDKQYSVINVENSNDLENKKNIEKEFNNVNCILAGENLGYGKANNIGLKKVKTKYALILNPDTELFSDTIENFLIMAKKNPDFALIGPNVKEDKKKDYLSTDEKNFYLIKSKFIKGYGMFLNLTHFAEIGFFDENFFIYLEEVDLCKRLLENNKKIFWCPNILIYHAGGSSHDSSANNEMELSRNWHWMWSTFYFNKKHKGFFVSFIIILPKLCSSAVKVLLYFLLFNKKKKEIYYQRLSGLINAIAGKKSWYRPNL